MARGIIFDIDGTLVDSVIAHARSWQLVFARYGHDIDLDAIRLQIGKGGDQLMPVFLPEALLQAKAQEIEQARSDLFKAEFLPTIKPFPSVRPLFERIVRDGKRIALASSAKGDELEAYKRLTGIGDLIVTATSSDDAERSKPDPDIFAAALRQLDLPADGALADGALADGALADGALVVGDSPYNAEAAGKIGIPAIGLLCGGFPAEMLRRAGFIAIYQDPADLLQHYDAAPL